MSRSRQSRVRRLRAAAAAAITAAVALAGCSGQGAAGESNSGENGEPTTVHMALQPLHQYAAWEFAQESGMAEELGVELEFTWLPQVDTAVQSLARGDLDMISTCTACNFPYLENSPDLRDAMIISQFKGFILIGQAGAPSYDELVAEGSSPDEAREEIFSYLEGRTFVLRESAFGALLNGLLDYAGLTRDDITLMDVADDSRAAQAFLQGEADFYMGSLAQESKLLRDHPDRAVNMGGAEILGPGGLWYDTMAVDQDWLDENEDTMLKLTAMWARIARYLTEEPETITPMITASINEHSGSSFEDGEIEQLIEEFLGFATLERWENEIFNTDSELYWRNSLEFYAEQNVTDGVLPESVAVDEHYVAEDLYNKFLEEDDLVEWVNSPLS